MLYWSKLFYEYAVADLPWNKKVGIAAPRHTCSVQLTEFILGFGALFCSESELEPSSLPAATAALPQHGLLVLLRPPQGQEDWPFYTCCAALLWL
jgi:hypothetical protein